jgi:hypothetical protein
MPALQFASNYFPRINSGDNASESSSAIVTVHRFEHRQPRLCATMTICREFVDPGEPSRKSRVLNGPRNVPRAIRRKRAKIKAVVKRRLVTALTDSSSLLMLRARNILPGVLELAGRLLRRNYLLQLNASRSYRVGYRAATWDSLSLSLSLSLHRLFFSPSNYSLCATWSCEKSSPI